PTSIPAALGCTTCSPSVQSCDFSFARFFCFDRDLDVDFCALDFCDVDFCDVDFCVLAIALFLRGEWTGRGSVSNGVKGSPTGSSLRLVFLVMRPPPRSPLFPYPTLFRSDLGFTRD